MFSPAQGESLECKCLGNAGRNCHVDGDDDGDGEFDGESDGGDDGDGGGDGLV